MMTFSSDTLRRSWDILAIQTSHISWPSCFSMSRNSLFFMEEQMFWRLSWACSFPLSTTSSFKDPAYPHGIKPKPLHWHGEKREQGLRAPHSIRTNRALPQQCWAQASRSATALGNSNKPISSTHFQAASSVCSQQHLLESQRFPHQNRNVLLEQLCFLFSQRHSLGNNCKMKCFTMTNLTFFLDQRKIVLILPLLWHCIEILFSAMCIQSLDFKFANLSDKVKNCFIPPNIGKRKMYKLFFPLYKESIYRHFAETPHTHTSVKDLKTVKRDWFYRKVQYVCENAPNNEGERLWTRKN